MNYTPKDVLICHECTARPMEYPRASMVCELCEKLSKFWGQYSLASMPPRLLRDLERVQPIRRGEQEIVTNSRVSIGPDGRVLYKCDLPAEYIRLTFTIEKVPP